MQAQPTDAAAAQTGGDAGASAPGKLLFDISAIDRTKLVKMSFRSKGDFACNEFAQKHFSGGGHRNASGGQSTESLEATVARFKETIRLYREDLSRI